MYLLHPRNYFSREKREKRRYIFNLYFTPTIITQRKKRIGKIIDYFQNYARIVFEFQNFIITNYHTS